MMKKLLLPLVWLALGQPVFAQQTAPAAGPELTVDWGFIFGGSGHTMREQMKNNGFGEEGGGRGFIPQKGFPRREESAVQIGLLYPMNEKYLVKGLFNYREGEVRGNAAYYEQLKIKSGVTSVAALAVKYVPFTSELLRVGLGPAYHRAKATLSTGNTELTERSFNKVGFVLETGLSTPAHSRFFADLQVQYFYEGKGYLGRHTLTGTNFSDNTVTRNVDFDKTKFSSFIFSLGVGFRFRKSEG